MEAWISFAIGGLEWWFSGWWLFFFNKNQRIQSPSQSKPRATWMASPGNQAETSHLDQEGSQQNDEEELDLESGVLENLSHDHVTGHRIIL